MDTKFAILFALGCLFPLIGARKITLRADDPPEHATHPVVVGATESEDHYVDQNVVFDHLWLDYESSEEDTVTNHKDIWFPPGDDAGDDVSMEEHKGHQEVPIVDMVGQDDGNAYDSHEDYDEYYKEYEEYITHGHHQYDGDQTEESSTRPSTGEKQSGNIENASGGAPKEEAQNDGNQSDSKGNTGSSSKPKGGNQNDDIDQNRENNNKEEATSEQQGEEKDNNEGTPKVEEPSTGENQEGTKNENPKQSGSPELSDQDQI